MCHYLHFSYDGNVVKTAPLSNYPHYRTSLGEIDNVPIAVGHDRTATGLKVEALQAGIWNVLSDYPFAKHYFIGYSMVNFKNALYIFGK